MEHLSTQHELSSKTGISFVYCNYKESQEASTYMKVVIKQLSRRMDELPVELENLYDKHYRNASNPGYKELQNVLIQISECFEKVFWVLDALDECSKDQRQEIFEVFSGIISPEIATRGNFKIFVTSRKEQDIQRAFERFEVVEVEAKKVNKDIESYVNSRLSQYTQDGTLEIPDSLKSTIISVLVDKAGGM